ncbi:LacI family DNA-binding transcriptional regulator (plasmid) [Chromobacterium amazonense]|uniref:LacI family DNA-binding transcriptional regulator n=1 Tax=Chromobacterium amazonense TaxID=1382803 RepID=UPI00237DA8B7|nr:LacI family DNA-binding transcriptional regulator [Chromobacterium amazonense]MDE1711424.1 LacI family DNA-binding transcriptional regulator [Chromobacterium amazonense]
MSRKPRVRSGSGVTMHDVARAAGVSAITVSRALNQPQQVSPALRDKVMQAVDALGYVPSRSASTLASARSRTVLVLIPSLGNTVFLDTLAGIETVLAEAGYQMLIGNSHYDAEQELQLLRAYLQHRPDGVLLTGLSHAAPFDALLRRHRLPAVYMMDLADDGRCCVGFSQEEAGARPDCDALFCCNDDLAIGALARCQQLGIAVPARLAVAGFNDLQPAAWCTPALTTVATPRREIGIQAARSLLAMIEGDAPPALRLDLGFALMLRRSS